MDKTFSSCQKKKVIPFVGCILIGMVDTEEESADKFKDAFDFS